MALKGVPLGSGESDHLPQEQVTVRGGKVSQWPKGVSIVCDAAASLRNGPGATRRPNFNVAAASAHFLEAKHLHIRVYASI